MKQKDKDFLLNMGQKIKEYRKAKKLSQETLAEKIDIHPTTLGRIEIGKLNASALMLNRIARALCVKIKDFFEF